MGFGRFCHEKGRGLGRCAVRVDNAGCMGWSLEVKGGVCGSPLEGGEEIWRCKLKLTQEGGSSGSGRESLADIKKYFEYSRNVQTCVGTSNSCGPRY